eukprot:TRINITY_DN6999_c0_g1_i5.p1 TRINITY_DN6999_c0_g1~~TRINITY_DN6999_c0_g1_i5.p1  ORF type:complete len:290 (+),score=8.79 TRINITY_DN6999_c0_g1_i5:315-1184(+)
MCVIRRWVLFLCFCHQNASCITNHLQVCWGTRNSKILVFRLIVSLFAVVFLLMLSIAGYSFYFISINKDECRDIPFLLFAVIFFGISLFFSISSFVIFQMSKGNHSNDTISAQNLGNLEISMNKGKQKKRNPISISSKYKVRHTRPMLIINIIYFISTLFNLVFRGSLFGLADPGSTQCRATLKTMHWFTWFSMVFRFIDLFFPLWVLIWYFHRTVRPKNSSNSNMNSLESDQTPSMLTQTTEEIIIPPLPISQHKPYPTNTYMTYPTIGSRPESENAFYTYSSDTDVN